MVKLNVYETEGLNFLVEKTITGVQGVMGGEIKIQFHLDGDDFYDDELNILEEKIQEAASEITIPLKLC